MFDTLLSCFIFSYHVSSQLLSSVSCDMIQFMEPEKRKKITDALEKILDKTEGKEREAVKYQIEELRDEEENILKNKYFNASVPLKKMDEKIYKEEAIKLGFKKIIEYEPSFEEDLRKKIEFIDNKLYFLKKQKTKCLDTDINIKYEATTGFVTFNISKIVASPIFECGNIEFYLDQKNIENINPKFTGILNFELSRSNEFEIIFRGKEQMILGIVFFPCVYLLDQDGTFEQRMQFEHGYIMTKITFTRTLKLIRKNAKIFQIVKDGHNLENFKIMSPFYCCVCDGLVTFFGQAYRCKKCKFTCHKKCSDYILFKCIIGYQCNVGYRKNYDVPHSYFEKRATGLNWCNHCGCRIESGLDCCKCINCNKFYHSSCRIFIFNSCLIDQNYRFQIAKFKPPVPEIPDREVRAKFEDFTLIKVVGRGSFGKVILAENKNHKKMIALKIFKKVDIVNSNEIAYLELERKILNFATKSRHPFLMKMDYCFQDSKFIYFGTEFLPGGDLFHHASKRNFSKGEIKLYACEILLGLGHLHENKIIYRDMKLDNILLDEKGHVKIVDFGLCKDNIGFDDETSTYCGTLDTIAPEIILQKPYTKDVDWWSYGVVLFELFEGKPPFNGATIEEIGEEILSVEILFTDQTPPDARDLILKLLSRDPKLRLGHGIGDYKEIQKHPYFDYIDWNRIMSCYYDPDYVPDTSFLNNFDQEFIDEKVLLSPSQEETKYDNFFINFR